MSEKCPLSGGAWRLEIPEICRKRCEDLWDKAIKDGATSGGYDVYKKPEDFDEFDGDICRHDGTPLQYSSDGLQSVDSTPLRFYAVIDSCMNCGIEFGEQSYQFECPNNDR